MQLLELINLTQLEVLGFNTDYLYYFLNFIAVLILFIVIFPLLVILLRKNYTFVVAYLLCSFLCLIFTLIIAQMNDSLPLIKTMLQVIAAFGCILGVYLLGTAIKKKIKKMGQPL